MRKLRFVFFFCLLGSYGLQAQVTITIDDIASVGDKIYVSNALPVGEFELGVTGEDMLWNYDWLSPNAQDSSVWVDPFETNPAYFFLWFGSNLAEATGQSFESDFFSLEDIYNFYDRSEGDLSITGIAGTITGIPLPATFDDPDMVYDLPLQYDDSYASVSGFNFTIPGIGSWQESRDRSCDVDGWGSITTPYGSFNALRVHCEIAIDDVFEYSGLEFPFSYVSHEYRWMAPDQLIPVLQINTQVILGFETVVSVTYIDTLMDGPLSIANTDMGWKLDLVANPVQNGLLQLQTDGVFQHGIDMAIIDNNGKTWIQENSVQPGTNGHLVSIAVDALPAGLYHLVIHSEEGWVRSLPFVSVH